MIPDELEALVLADSVGALDPDELVELQARLVALTPGQRSEVARLYDAATAVASSVPPLEPPARVRQRVLAEARAPAVYTVRAAAPRGSTPVSPASVPASSPSTRPDRSSPW